VKSHIVTTPGRSLCGKKTVRILAVLMVQFNRAKRPEEATCKTCRALYGLK
jgi:hypothetical protein